MLVAGTTSDGTENMLERIAPYRGIYAAVGIHPHDVINYDGDIERFCAFSQRQDVRAIGEIGLDYYYNDSSEDVQIRVFKDFLTLAKKTNKPAVIHCREAFDDCYEITSEILEGEHPFVIHCFTGSIQWAEKFIALGGYLSFNGIITFKNSDSVRSVLREIPLKRILLETDSPYLAPTPYRGKTNEPAYMPFIVAAAADTLCITEDELIHISTNNARHFFAINGDV